MRTIALGIARSVVLVGCAEKTGDKQAVAEKPPAADLAAGKAIAERDCKACHGLDGRGVAPAIPHLAAQRARYLYASLNEYKDGKRTHAALRGMTAQMSEADMRNVAGYFASLPPVDNPAAGDVKHSSPYEQGKALAATCAKCHGEDGNSKIPGTPSLAGQQPHYLVAAIQEYHQGDRKAGTMRSMLRESDTVELQNLALYFAAQIPAERPSPSRGDPAAGQPLTAMCGGCHGSGGVSVDAATPSLARDYLIMALRAYRDDKRESSTMHRMSFPYSNAIIESLATWYSSQPAN